MRGFRVNWRRVSGSALMVIGGAGALAMLLLAAIVTANFVEWENSAEALSTIAIIVAPPAILGVCVLLLGRWVFGGWRNERPLRVWGVRMLGMSSALGAATLAAMLALNISSGFGAHNRVMVIAMAAGLIVTLSTTMVSLRPWRRQQSA